MDSEAMDEVKTPSIALKRVLLNEVISSNCPDYKQSLHTLSPGVNGYTFLKSSHLMLKSNNKTAKFLDSACTRGDSN